MAGDESVDEVTADQLRTGSAGSWVILDGLAQIVLQERGRERVRSSYERQVSFDILYTWFYVSFLDNSIYIKLGVLL